MTQPLGANDVSDDPNERGGNTCHGETVYITTIHTGEYVVRGAKDGQLYIATFADSQQATSFVMHCRRSASLIRGVRP